MERRTSGHRFALPSSRRRHCRGLAAVIALVAGTLAVLSSWRAVVGSVSPAAGAARIASLLPPPPLRSAEATTAHARILADVWRQVDDLRALVKSRGVVRGFGRRADDVVRRAVARAGATGAVAASFEQVVDLPLRALFQQQLQALQVRAVNRYEEEVATRPNPLEAGRAAERVFLEGAADLARPGGNWVFEVEHRDLLNLLDRSHSHDTKAVEELGRHGRGKQVTIEVIRKLQEQAATMQHAAEQRGALPLDVQWQYMVTGTPVGLRGVYSQGRSIVELLLTPTNDPRRRKGGLFSLLERIGPLNVAVAFDAFV